jgi:hypothetical protein
VAVPNFPAAVSSWSVAIWVRLSTGQLASDTMDMWATILSTESLGSGGWELNIDHPLNHGESPPTPGKGVQFWKQPFEEKT